jgi:hypothetical protein
MIRSVQAYEQPAPRLEAVLHYVIARTMALEFGAIKINKTIVGADAEFFRRYGRTITGANAFQKQQFGPVPNGVVKALASLKRAKKILPNPVYTPAGPREEYLSLEEPDVAQFDATEIDVMSIVIAGLQRLTANAASERTHDALWDEVPMFGQIPIQAAAFKPTEVDQDVLTWALASEA